MDKSKITILQTNDTRGYLALDNGDTFHGTFHAVHSEGEAFIEPVSLLGLDAWTVHWDFAYGPDRLRELAADRAIPDRATATCGGL